MNGFYLILEKIFPLQLGKILLATASSSQLQEMVTKDWPYFTQYSQDIDPCLNGSSCPFVQSLGNFNKVLQIQL